MEKLNRAQKCSILGPQNLGSRGGARAPGTPPGSAPVRTRVSLLGPISFNIMHFLRKIGQNNRFAPHLCGWRPPLGNPGSATVFFPKSLQQYSLIIHRHRAILWIFALLSAKQL